MEKNSIAILIVDDDANLTSNLQDILGVEGYSITIAHDGETALNLSHQKVFDLGLIDMRLPGMSGMELTKKLSERQPQMEYIIITGYASLESAMAAVERKDLVAYVTKPLDMDHLLALTRQVSERNQAEKTLSSTEANFRRSLDDSPLGIRIVNADGELAYANQAMLDIYGCAGIEELKATPAMKRYTPESYAEFQVRKEKRQRGDYVPSHYEVSIMRKNGEIRHLEVFRKEVLWNGKPQFQVLHNDISLRKQAEEAQRESEEKYAKAFQTSPYAITITSIDDGKFIEVNDAFTSISGFTRQEATADSSVGLKLWVDIEDRKQVLSALSKGSEVIGKEFQFRRKNGENITGLFSAKIIYLKVKPYILSSINDITDRKRAEEVLLENRAKLQLTFDEAPISIATVSMDKRFLSCNKAFCAFLGYSEDELKQKTIADITLPEDLNIGMADMRAIAMGEMKTSLVQKRYVQKDGRVVWGEVCINLVRNSQGKPMYFLPILQDTTQRKQAELKDILNSQRIQTLLQLNQMTGSTLKEITDFTLEEAVRLTQSKIGYLAFLNEDESVLTMHSWSKSAMAECAIIDKPIVYPVVSTGLWGEAVRQRQPVITNDYTAANPLIKGIPAGHVALKRHMNVPVFDGSRIVIVAGVGNKTEEYNQGDVQQLTLLMAGMWQILQRKRAEETLHDNELKYRTLFETADDALLLFTDGRWVDCNTAASRVFGCAREQIIGAHPIRFSPPTQPDGRSSEEEAIKKINLAFTLGPQSFEWEHCRADGIPFPAEVHLNRLDLGGKPHMQAIVRDITKRKQAEEELRNDQLMLARTESIAHVGSWEWDIASDTVTWSDELFRIFQRDPQQGAPSFAEHPALYHPEDMARLKQSVEAAIAHGTPYELELRAIRKDGETRLCLARGVAEMAKGGRAVRLFGSLQDITERKQAEQALQQSEKKYRSLFSNMVNGFAYCQMLYDKDNKPVDYIYLEVNDAFVGLTGLRKNDVIGKRVTEAIPGIKDSNPEIIDTYGAVALTGKPASFEVYFKPLDKWLAIWVYSPRKDYFVTVFDNITTRKQAEEDLRQSEDKHRTLFETMAQGVVYQNADGHILSANTAATRILGLTLDQLQERTSLDRGWKAIHEDGSDFPGDTHPAMVALRTGKEVRNVVMGVFHPGENEYVWVSINATPQFKQGEAKPYQVYTTFADITERKKAEVERLRTETLESIGTLAGGIAHDFNNFLTIILGNIELANAYLKQNKADSAQELLAEAEQASLHAKGLTLQLLTFAKGGVPVKKVMLINQLLKESVSFASRGGKVKPEFTIPDNLWQVEVDAGQINQVIDNLVINANQAMPNGGVLNVCAGNLVIKKNKAIPLPDGKYIKIDIQDHGVGISEENKVHIFEPYFTTKKKGSGLGLLTSYSIIKNHGGYITFESEVGIGTTFSIYLPATKEKAKKVLEKLSTQPLPLTQGRILVMDDEDSIRTLLGRMLTDVGYEVELTGNGAEAIEKYTEAKESRNPFGAVILDLTVPGGMGGKGVIEKLLMIDPGVKAIVSSGYANDPIMADYKKYGFKGVVTKPYDIRQMKETLRNIIVDK